MLQKNTISSTPPTTSRNLSTRNRNFPNRLMYQQAKERNIKTIIKPPSSLVMNHIDSSISVLTTKTNVRTNYVKPSEPSVKVNLVKKKVKKNVSTNNTIKKSKLKNQTIDSNEHKECPGCKKVFF